MSKTDWPKLIGSIRTSKSCGKYEVVQYINYKKILVKFVDSGYEKYCAGKEVLSGRILDPSTPKVFGWGINDVDYPVTRQERVNGKSVRVWTCPYYNDWVGILERSISPRLKDNQSYYIDCTVCEEWKYFSNFIKWVDSQPNRDWVNCVPDKDLLISGNKHYSHTTVAYVSVLVNAFITDRKSIGNMLTGVSLIPESNNKKQYKVYCNDPFNNESRYVGYFSTEIEAHKAWQAKKHKYACMLADLQDDPRVADALRQRYAPDKDWTDKKGLR